MQYSKMSAFSAFELLCVIIIMAMIASVGIRYLGYISDKQCLLDLKARLSHMQSALSSYYTDSFIRGNLIDISHAYNILSTITHSNKAQCGFRLEKHKLIATIGTQNIPFDIDPPTLVLNPRIFCSLELPLCKELSDRSLNK